jgi:hypothetical protein
MSETTTDIVIVTGLLVGFALFGLAALLLVLRVGPRRGSWNQPAAKLRQPGRRMFLSMYVVAALHVIAGLGLAIFAPGGGLAIFLVLLVMGTFYALGAHSWSLAHRVARRTLPG